jgi:hypothetical protein
MPFNKILLLGTAENVEQADSCGITQERIIYLNLILKQGLIPPNFLVRHPKSSGIRNRVEYYLL